jgi:hypothetical protein
MWRKRRAHSLDIWLGVLSLLGILLLRQSYWRLDNLKSWLTCQRVMLWKRALAFSVWWLLLCRSLWILLLGILLGSLRSRLAIMHLCLCWR